MRNHWTHSTPLNQRIFQRDEKKKEIWNLLRTNLFCRRQCVPLFVLLFGALGPSSDTLDSITITKQCHEKRMSFWSLLVRDTNPFAHRHRIFLFRPQKSYFWPSIWMPLQKFSPYTLVLVSLAGEGVVGSEFVSIISSSGRARSALFSNSEPACSLFFQGCII